jgi:hypothetical protein
MTLEGHYIQKVNNKAYKTENDFLIEFDRTIERQCKWVVFHLNQEVAMDYEEQGYDRLFATLKEAVIYVSDL